MKNKNNKDIVFIKKYFKNKKDGGGNLLWQHAVDTAETLQRAAKQYREIQKETLEKMLCAALGHDLLEDTTATEKDIENQWGNEVLYYIKILTNPKGDDDFTEYINDLQRSDEEILLIKFADIHSNLSNSLDNKNLDIQWLESFWLPLLLNYKKKLFSIPFKKYSKTANHFIKEINSNIKNLQKKTASR